MTLELNTFRSHVNEDDFDEGFNGFELGDLRL